MRRTGSAGLLAPLAACASAPPTPPRAPRAPGAPEPLARPAPALPVDAPPSAMHRPNARWLPTDIAHKGMANPWVHTKARKITEAAQLEALLEQAWR
jgi:hypothetical protein